MTSQNVYTPGDPAVENIDPSTPLGRLLSISTRLMPSLWFCPAIPPQLCGELAEESKEHNRKRSYQHVSLMASQMKKGLWRKNIGCDIHFHRDGWLANGQHRLQAAKLANAPFYALIRTGLDNRDAAAVDQHRKRSPSDILAISFGAKDNLNVRTCVARVILQYKSGDFSFKKVFDGYSVGEVATGFTDEQMNILRIIRDLSVKIGFMLSIVGGIVLICHEKDKEKTEKFIQTLKTGLTTDPTDPAYLFRQYVMSARESRKGKTWVRKEHAQMIIKAMNLLWTGEKKQILKASPKGSPAIDLACCPVLSASGKKLASLMDVVK